MSVEEERQKHRSRYPRKDYTDEVNAIMARPVTGINTVTGATFKRAGKYSATNRRKKKEAGEKELEKLYRKF